MIQQAKALPLRGDAKLRTLGCGCTDPMAPLLPKRRLIVMKGKVTYGLCIGSEQVTADADDPIWKSPQDAPGWVSEGCQHKTVYHSALL